MRARLFAISAFVVLVLVPSLSPGLTSAGAAQIVWNRPHIARGLQQPAQVTTQTPSVHLPLIARRYDGWLNQSHYPNPELADTIWRAVERFVEEYPPAEIYPGLCPGGRRTFGCKRPG